MALINVLDQYVYIMVYEDIPTPDGWLERWRDVFIYVVQMDGCMYEWMDG